jgi:hypothetical protein
LLNVAKRQSSLLTITFLCHSIRKDDPLSGKKARKGTVLKLAPCCYATRAVCHKGSALPVNLPHHVTREGKARSPLPQRPPPPLLIPKLAQIVFLLPPVFFYLHPEIQKDRVPKNFFQLQARFCTDFFKHAAFLTDNNSFL